MTQNVTADIQAKYLQRYTALKRMGLPEYIAHIVLSVEQPAAAFLTEATIPVDDGLLVHWS